MVTAQAKRSGICNREQWDPEFIHERRIGTIGTVLSGNVGPA